MVGAAFKTSLLAGYLYIIWSLSFDETMQACRTALPMHN